MRKKIAVLAIVLFVSLSLFAGATKETQSDVIKVDVANLYTDGSVCDLASKELVNLLNDSGLFEVNYYPNSQLGSLYDQIESLLADAPIITLGGGSDWGDRVNVREMSVIMTPFMYEDLDDVWGIANSDLWKEMLKDAEKSGVKILNYPIVSGSRYFMTNKKVTVPADFAGQKIRVPNSSAYINAFNAFGATPTPISVGDLYMSLSQKLVDGCEFPYANAYQSQFYEVIKYAAKTPYVTTYDFFGISLKLWNSMSAEQQKTLEDSLAKVSAYSFNVFPSLEAEGREMLADKGMEFIDIDADAFRARMEQYYELSGWTDEFKATITKAMSDYKAGK